MFIQLFKTFKDNLSPHFVCACWFSVRQLESGKLLFVFQ
jgi:hypothetical protein